MKSCVRLNTTAIQDQFHCMMKLCQGIITLTRNGIASLQIHAYIHLYYARCTCSIISLYCSLTAHSAVVFSIERVSLPYMTETCVSMHMYALCTHIIALHCTDHMQHLVAHCNMWKLTAICNCTLARNSYCETVEC